MIRRLIRHALRRPADEGGDLGGAPEPVAIEAPAAEAPAAEQPQPASMHDAMWNRDEQGRFAPKQPEAAAAPAAPVVPGAPAAPAQPAAAKPAEPAAPAGPEDLTAMPEGLQPKAQERFQKLANGIRERDQQIEQLGAQVTYVQQQFQQHGVSQPQFEQALSVIGALNRGDYRTALQALDEQRRQIALQLGEPLPGVDALSEFPDLRQRVDALQIAEADAIELARMRKHQATLQQRQQAEQQTQQQAQQQQQAVQAAQGEVDMLCKRLQGTDLDYPAIEALLLPEIPNLLQGIPPTQWARVVETQYRLIKNSGAAFRRPAPTAGAPTPAPLRSTGQAGAAAPASSMYDAMWNRR